MRAILAFCHFAIREIVASTALFPMIDRAAEDAIDQELVHWPSSPLGNSPIFTVLFISGMSTREILQLVI